MKDLLGYLFLILVWIDQGLNVIFGPALNFVFRVDGFGDEDETLSSVMGKYRHVCRLCRWMCWLMGLVDNGHCDRTIEYDEGKTP